MKAQAVHVDLDLLGVQVPVQVPADQTQADLVRRALPANRNDSDAAFHAFEALGELRAIKGVSAETVRSIAACQAIITHDPRYLAQALEIVSEGSSTLAAVIGLCKSHNAVDPDVIAVALQHLAPVCAPLAVERASDLLEEAQPDYWAGALRALEAGGVEEAQVFARDFLENPGDDTTPIAVLEVAEHIIDSKAQFGTGNGAERREEIEGGYKLLRRALDENGSVALEALRQLQHFSRYEEGTKVMREIAMAVGLVHYHNEDREVRNLAADLVDHISGMNDTLMERRRED